MTARRYPVIVLTLFVTACSSGSTPSPSPNQTFTATLAPTSSAAPLEEPVMVSGDGTMQSSTFALAGGNYAAKWTGEAHAGTTAACFLYLQLRAVGGPYYEVIINTSVEVGPPTSRITHLSGEPPGSYYVDASSECLWSVTLTAE